VQGRGREGEKRKVKRLGISVGVFLGSAAAALLADLATKEAVVRWLAPSSSINIIGDYVRITHVRNVGASFGLFPGNTHVLIAASSLAVLVVIYLAFRSRGRIPAMSFLGLILGGALGNLYDRVRLGEVVDFIDVGFGSNRWPVFNVADIAVTAGVILMLLEYLTRGAARAGRTDEVEAGDEHGKIVEGEGGDPAGGPEA
jgi:signal peptidase II